MSMNECTSVPMSSATDLMSVREVAALTGHCEGSIRALCRRGEIPSVKIGNRICIPRGLFQAQIEEQLRRAAYAREVNA